MTLQESLLNPTNRPQVVKDCVVLIDEQVGDAGLIVKGAYKVVTTFKSGIIEDAVDTLVDDFVARLDPFHADFLAAGGGSSATTSRAGARRSPTRCWASPTTAPRSRTAPR